MSRTTAIPLALASLAVLAACSSAEEPPADDVAVTEPTTTEAPEQETEAQETDDEGDTAASAPGASRDNPAAPGETVQWEDYEATIGETNYDATEWALQPYADDYYGGDLSEVPPLDEGMVYISAPISLTYVGEEVGEPNMDITVSYVTADGNVHDTPNAHPALDDLRDASEMYPDASLEANIMIEVPEEAAEGGVWRLYDTFAEQRVEVFFATE